MAAIHLEAKPKFIDRYKHLTDFDAYWKSVQSFAPKTIRVNTLKADDTAICAPLQEQGYILSRVPWAAHAYDVLGDAAGLGETDAHRQGLFFIQNSVSLLPAIALDPKPHEIVLDCCASPGAKTTQLAAMMNNTGIIIANEALTHRIPALKANLSRCGVCNTIITHESGDRIAPRFQFDRILLDAPCSGSGLIKGPTQVAARTLKEWNPNTVRRMAKLQKALIIHSYALLKPAGILVYSTCSLEPEEDEQVIEFLQAKTGARLLPTGLKIKTRTKPCTKIWPQDNNTFGFFIAKIQKPGE